MEMTKEIEQAGTIPLGPRLLVKPVPLQEKTQGGIVIPRGVLQAESMMEIQADVIAVGDECWEGRVPWCKAGDRIVIARSCGLRWEADTEEDYRFISHLDVVGLVLKKGE